MHQHQQSVGKIVPHHKVQVPPAAQDHGSGGKKQQQPPQRLRLFKAVVQSQQQDGKGKDKPEPVRLCQQGAHAQEGVGDQPGKTNEEVPQPVADLQKLPRLDDQPCQHHQQGGQDAEHLTQGKAVSGAVGEAEGKVQKQGDEAGVILPKAAKNGGKPGGGTLGKGCLCCILQGQVVGIVPDVHKAAAVQRPEKVQQRCRPDPCEDGAVEQVQPDLRHPQNTQSAEEQSKAAPKAYQRKKRPAAGGGKSKHGKKGGRNAKEQQHLATCRHPQPGKDCRHENRLLLKRWLDLETV